MGFGLDSTGGTKMCKTRSAMGMSKQDTWKIRDFITLGGSAVAEFVTGAFLGACEELDAETDVVNGLFFVFGLTFWQTPCTMVKISVQQRMAETIYQNLVTTQSEMSIDVILMLSLVYDIAIVVVSLTECPDSEFNLESYLKDPKRMRSNTTITGDHEKTVFLDAILLVACQACTRTRTISPHKWQIRTTRQPNGKFMCGDYTTEFEKENDDLLEETFMTIYVKSINGKTISIKYEGKITAAVISDEVERRSSIPLDMTYLVHKGKVMSEKKTIKENNIEEDATIEMSLRLLGGMEKNEHMDTHETEEEREKKRKLEEGKEGKMTKPNDDTVYLRRDILEALKRSDENMDRYSRKTDEKMESYSRMTDEKKKATQERPMKEWTTSQEKLMRCCKSLRWSRIQ